MKLIVFLIFNIYIISVNGFFYTLLPLTAIKRNNVYKAYCPWNQTKDKELKCKVNKGVMGYFHLKSGELEAAKPEPTVFLNPALQKRFTEDNCKKIKGDWSVSKSKDTVCNKYSFCFNIADDKSICSCQNGFFGDPYTGCHQHCLTDDDCSSPLAKCAESTVANQLNRCVCKQGYDGDGVLCHTNVCGNDRREKCGGANSHKVCVPTGSGPRDFTCICENGYFLNHKKECVPEFTVKENTVITIVGKNIADGSRVELGDCLSFVINDKTKSIFYHKNSGDSIYVRNDIKNDKQFSIFFIVTKEVTAFSLLKEGIFGLAKLYSMTNTFLGCKFGNAKIFDPEGHDVSDEESFLDLIRQEADAASASVSSSPGSPESEALGAKRELGTQDARERAGEAGSVGTGGGGAVASAEEARAETEGQQSVTTQQPNGVSTLQKESSVDEVPDTESEAKVIQTSEQDSNSGQEPQAPIQTQNTEREVQPQTARSQPESETNKQDEKPRPSVEVYVRELTAAEKSGGLAGHPLPRSMAQIASQEEPVGLEVGSSRAKGHHDASHLQMSLSPETARQMDL